MTTVHDFISTRFVVPLFERYSGDYSRRYVREVQRVQSSSRRQVETFQLERLQKVFARALDIPFYRERLAAAGIASQQDVSFERIRALRPMGREDFRAAGRELRDLGLLPQDAVKSATGGTTSSPVPFYMNPGCVRRRWAATRYFDGLYGYLPGRKIAYLWGALQDIPKYKPGLKPFIRKHLVNRQLAMPATRLGQANMMSYYRSLESFAPYLLQAYPTALTIFSRFLLEHRLSLHIPVITCTAEAMSEEQRETITEAFGVKPFNWYGARDAGRIASECTAYSGLHVNCYGLYIEIAGPSDTGKVLITDLWNTAMPIIRYEIGDVAEIDHSMCACGSHVPRLTQIVGRTADILIAMDGRLLPGVTMVNRITKASDEIKGLQIVQKSIGEFQMKVVAGEEYDEQESPTRLIAQFHELTEERSSVRIDLVEEIPVEPSGKARLCRNEMAASERDQFL